MVKTGKSRQFTDVFHQKNPKVLGRSQQNENEESLKKTLKSFEAGGKSKRRADMSPKEAPSRKRSAFGDITNAIFKNQPDKKKDKKTLTRKLSSRRTKKSHNATKSKEDVNALLNKANSEEQKIEADILSSLSEDSLTSSQESNASCYSQETTSSSCSSDSNASVSDGSQQIVEAVIPVIDQTTSEDISQSKQEDTGEASSDVVDIDADKLDVFAVNEYADEIFRNMKRREDRFPMKCYMAKQTDISPSMRAVLVDWLVEVQENFELYHETLYLSVKMVDHYLQEEFVKRENLQLVGATALFIACKIEERHPPCLEDFLYICDDAYGHKQLVDMEQKLLCTLVYDINIPIPYRFLRRYAKAAFADVPTLTLARYILESTLVDYRFLEYKASFLAAACLCLALLMKNICDWNATLVHYTGYTKQELKDCVLLLNTMISEPPKKALMTVRNKYSHQVFHSVAKIPPLDVLAQEF